MMHIMTIFQVNPNSKRMQVIKMYQHFRMLETLENTLVDRWKDTQISVIIYTKNAFKWYTTHMCC